MSKVSVEEIIDTLIFVEQEPPQLHQISLFENWRCSLVVSVLKGQDNDYSFGYSVKSQSSEKTMNCGRSYLKGNLQVLFLGYLKVLTREDPVAIYSTLNNYLTSLIVSLDKAIVRPPVDESKIRLDKWKIPQALLKDYKI